MPRSAEPTPPVIDGVEWVRPRPAPEQVRNDAVLALVLLAAAAASLVLYRATGYGDVVPVGWAAETASVVEIVVGQFFLVAAMGKIVTAWVPRRREQQ